MAELPSNVIVLPAKLPKLVIYIEPELKARLERLAKVERRSLSSMAVVAIEAMVKQAEDSGKTE